MFPYYFTFLKTNPLEWFFIVIIFSSMDWISVSSHNRLAGVGLDCGMVDMRSLNNFLDGVNLVGTWDWDSTWYGNINVVVLDIDRVRGNGRIRCWRSRNSCGSNRSGLNNELSSSGNNRMGRLLYCGLNSPVSDNCKLVKMVVIVFCGFWKSSSINI